MSWPSHLKPTGRPQRFGAVTAAVLLLAPAGMMLFSAGRGDGVARSVALAVGATVTLEALFLLTRYGPQRAADSLFAVSFYATAALVLRFNAPDLTSPATHAMLAAALLIPVVLFLRREVNATGGNAREAKFLLQKMLARQLWPATFAEYRDDPLVQSVRNAVRDNAAPLLPLLAHDDIQIQVAALTALEGHPAWRKGQAEAVLQRATFTEQPAVRAAGLLALANVTKARHLHSLLPFLRDPSEEVRRAAAIAVLWDAANRWPEVRGQVRLALAAPHAAKDGPLPCSGSLPAVALDDLVRWAVESGPIGRRATLTLIRHCKKAIHEDGSPEAVGRVISLVVDPKVPPAIRVELAHRLQAADALPADVAALLLGQGEPTMLRVLAAGAVLARHEDAAAVDVLREAGRQPNREIAVAAAGLVQKYLGVDLGLPVGGELPATNSREAAEITRRLARWAADPGSHVGTDTPVDEAVPASDVAYF